MRGKSTEYTSDFEGVYLMRSVFPAMQDKTAIAKMIAHDREIKAAAAKLFNKNYNLFARVGLNRSDVESTMRVYVYIYFSKYGEQKNFLNRFLQQRSIKFITTCMRKSQGIVEELNTLTDKQINDLYDCYAHNDDPESILIAQEQAVRIASNFGREK